LLDGKAFCGSHDIKHEWRLHSDWSLRGSLDVHAYSGGATIGKIRFIEILRSSFGAEVLKRWSFSAEDKG